MAQPSRFEGLLAELRAEHAAALARQRPGQAAFGRHGATTQPAGEHGTILCPRPLAVSLVTDVQHFADLVKCPVTPRSEEDQHRVDEGKRPATPPIDEEQGRADLRPATPDIDEDQQRAGLVKRLVAPDTNKETQELPPCKLQAQQWRKVRETLRSGQGFSSSRSSGDGNSGDLSMQRQSNAEQRSSPITIHDLASESTPLQLPSYTLPASLHHSYSAASRRSDASVGGQRLTRGESLTKFNDGWLKSLRRRGIDDARLGDLSEYLSCGIESESDLCYVGRSSSLRSRVKKSWLQTLSQCTMVGPNRPLRLCFDAMSILVLTFDMIVTPVVVAWDLPNNDQLQSISFFMLVFWTLDMVLSFRTGFYEDGELQMAPCKTTMQYLRTWFVADAIAVSTDYVSFALNLAGGVGVRITRLSKLARLFRLAGLARMVRKMQIVHDFLDHRVSDSIIILFDILKLFIGILWLNHIEACAWYAIGRYAESDTGRRWTSVFSDDDANTSSNVSYEFWTSLHWSLSQLTPGSMQVSPTNTSERQFNVICLCFGLLFVSSLVSSMSASMMRLHMLKQDRVKNVRLLRKFLRQHAVQATIAVRIQKQVIGRMAASRSRVGVKEVSVFAFLSTALHAELQTDIFRRFLQTHPLFRLLFHVHTETMSHLCCEAVATVFLSSDDKLFRPGSDAKGAYFLVSGSLSYTQLPGLTPVANERHATIVQGQWFCEAALWCHWAHVGAAVAESQCQLVAVSGDSMVKVVAQHHTTKRIIHEYGGIFYERLIVKPLETSDWEMPSDLSVYGTDFGEIVLCMTKSVRVLIGEVALMQTDASLPWIFGLIMGDRADKLHQEVQSGHSTMVQLGSGAIERIVFLVAMRMVRKDGCILARIAQWKDDHFLPDCMLPGLKGKVGQSADEIVQLLMQSELAPLASRLILQQVEREVSTSKSARFSVHTKYFKMIQHAVFEENFFPNGWGDADQSFIRRLTVEFAQETQAGSRLTARRSSLLGRIGLDDGQWFDAPPSHHMFSDVFMFTGVPDPAISTSLRDQLPSQQPSAAVPETPRLASVWLQPDALTGPDPPTSTMLPADQQLTAHVPSQWPSAAGPEAPWKGKVYAWLRPDDFLHLSAPAGGQMLEHMLQTIDTRSIAQSSTSPPRRPSTV